MSSAGDTISSDLHMTYAVVVRSSAWRDVERNFNRLAQNSTQGAADWYGAFLQAASELAEAPSQYPIVANLRRPSAIVRFKLFQTRRGRPYHLVFTIDESDAVVHVLCVRSPGQPPVRRRDLT